jgi:hypothetical protein
MPDRAQQLAIIQKLIDAGESQENIDTVVESFKQTAHPPAGSGPNPFSAERRDDRPVEEPGVLETIGRSLFKAAAQPESAGDVASLMTATPMMGAGRIASQAAQIPGQVPGMLRSMGRGVGKTISHVAEEYVPYWAKPFEGAGKDIGGFLQKVSQEPGVIGSGKWGPNPAGAVSGPAGQTINPGPGIFDSIKEPLKARPVLKQMGDTGGPRIKLATQELPNLKEIETMLRAQGVSPERIQQILREQAINLGLTAPKNY